MAGNPHKGEVSFEAGGQTRTIRLSTNAICTMEANLGMSMAEIFRRLQDGNFRTLREALRTCGGKLSLDQAGEIIDEIGYLAAARHFERAYELAFPPPADESAEGDDPQTGGEAGTGSNS